MGGTQSLVLAFVGASSIGVDGLQTRTDDEVAIKRAFIGKSREVFILVDHSKLTPIVQGKKFSGFDRKKMTVLTDRPEAMKAALPEILKRVRGCM